MRSRTARALLAAPLLAAALPALSQSSCREGYELVTTTLPNGRVQAQCLPAAAVQGRSHASPKSPVGAPPPATCPCFVAADVQAAIAASNGVYQFQESIFRDPLGNTCTYRQVASLAGLFASMAKPQLPSEPCITVQLFPLSAIEPNGCFSLDQDGSVVLRPIPVAEAEACNAALAGFRQ